MVKNLFATPLWEYKVNSVGNLNEKLIAAAEQYEAKKNYFDIADTNVQFLHSEIKNRVKEIARGYGWPTDNDVQLIGRQNPIQPGGCDTPHFHAESILVGVYYLRVPDNSGDILFHDPRGSVNWVDPQTDKFPTSVRPFYRYKPEPGTLLLFPGYLVHSVEANLSNEVRFSIAISVR